MSFELTREESLAENVARLARARLDRVLGALAVMDDAPPTPAAIHESRRDLKKLRALVRLARHTLGREIYQRENAAYRDLGRVLSASRDAQVLLHTFDKLRPELTGLVPNEAWEALHRGLCKDVHDAEKTLMSPGRLTEVAAALTLARERVEAWPQPRGNKPGAWRLPVRAVAATFRRGRRSMRRAAKRPAETDFHEWRKQVKHLTYHFRLLRPLWRRAFKVAGEDLALLGDLLGNEHDLAVLAMTLAREHHGTLETLATVTDHIDVRRRELQEAALKLGKRLYRLEPDRFKKRLKRYWKEWHAEEKS